jgi:hypothetical protein
MMTIVGSIFDLYFITDGFLFALIYIWCKVKPFRELELMMGIRMQSNSILTKAVISLGFI